MPGPAPPVLRVDQRLIQMHEVDDGHRLVAHGLGRQRPVPLDDGLGESLGVRGAPQGQARVRSQMWRAHTREVVEQAVRAFVKVGTKAGVI